MDDPVRAAALATLRKLRPKPPRPRDHVLSADGLDERALRARSADPADHAARYELGRLLLAKGDYAGGWPLLESRLETFGRKPPLNDTPEWLGQPLKGKSILVVGEQGLGDQIMFARFIPDLIAQGGQVSLLVRRELMSLLAPLGARMVPPDSESVPRHHYYAWIDSLPGRLGVTVEGLSGAPYLPRPAGAGGGIGVVWRGGPAHTNDANRSLPDGSALLSLPGARSLHPEDTGVADFSETAEIVAGLDLVVSVDTSVVHLAGAMGKACWVLLPCRHTDWRWLRGRSDSPWYDSLTLFRQTTPGAWDPVIRDIEQRIAAVGWR